jgi:hypothetical protein
MPSARELVPHHSLVRSSRMRIGRVEQRLRAQLDFERLDVRLDAQ